MDHVPAATALMGETACLPDRAERRPVKFDAQLMFAGGAALDARVLDLSYDGCQIDAGKAVAEGDSVQLSVRGRGISGAIVRWCKDGRAGLQFAEARDNAGREAPRGSGGMEAQIRRIGRPCYWVELRDLSPEGCTIDVVERPAMDEVMQLKLPGLETVQARVSWIDGYVAGLKFERPIHPAVFALLLQRMGR